MSDGEQEGLPGPLLAGSLPAGGVPTDAAAAAERIVAWHDAMKAVSQTMQAQVMECCWIIRREIPERDAFASFAGERLGGRMQPDMAWRLAETWDVARRNRRLRELAWREPDEAVRLVHEMAEATADGEQGALSLDETDRKVAAIWSSPKRKRHLLLRELVQSQGAAVPERHPDDVSRIEDLERERREAFERQLAGSRVSDIARELQETEAGLARIAEMFGDVELSQPQRERLQMFGDQAMVTLERIMERITLGPEGGDAA